MYNQVALVGRLTRDPELRYTTQGTSVANFSIAVERDYAGADGKKKVDFIDVVVWQKLAEVVANHLKKGRLVLVDGRLETDVYEHEGKRRKSVYVTANKVKFLDWGKNADRNRDDGEQSGVSDDGTNFGYDYPGSDVDEVPF